MPECAQHGQTARQDAAIAANLKASGVLNAALSTAAARACLQRNIAHARLVQKNAPTSTNQIVAGLEGIGLLREITGYARNRRFRFEPYLRLFEETEE